MRSDWETLTLGSAGVSLIDCDHRTPPAAEAGYPYIAIPQLKDGHIDLSDVRRISAENFADWTKKLLPQEHDVIVVRRCSSGVSAVVPKNLKCAIGQNLVILRADGKRVRPGFLRWLVRGNEWWEQVRKYMNVGAVFDSLKCRDIPNFEVLVPPLDEQDRITGVLDALDDRIDLLRQTNTTLESIAQALFKSWFIEFDPVRTKAEGREPECMDAATAALFPAEFEASALGSIPKGWTVQPFGALLAHAIGGDWGAEEESTDCTLPATIIRGTDIPDICAGRYQTTPRRFVSPRKAMKRVLQDSDLVIEVSGGSKTQPTGRSLYVTQDLLGKLGDTVVPTSFCRLFRALDAQTALVLGRHLDHIYRAGKMWNYQVQSTGLANFQTQHFLDSEMVVVAPHAVFAKFFELARPLVDRIHAAPIAELEAVRDALLPRLISGKLRLPEAKIQIEEATA